MIDTYEVMFKSNKNIMDIAMSNIYEDLVNSEKYILFSNKV